MAIASLDIVLPALGTELLLGMVALGCGPVAYQNRQQHSVRLYAEVMAAIGALRVFVFSATAVFWRFYMSSNSVASSKRSRVVRTSQRRIRYR